MISVLNADDRLRLNQRGPGQFGDRIAAHEAGGYTQVKSWAAPAATSSTAVLPATTLANGATTTVTTGITQPDVTRCLRILGNQAGINGTVVINGTDNSGAVISESIVANAGNVVEGVRAFRTITSIVFPARNGAGDTISVGWNDKLGLDEAYPRDPLVRMTADGVHEATRATVAFSATVLSQNTVDPNTALNGAVTFWAQLYGGR